jgi:4-hydroxy-3-polyprenylbenzoate decarboxylase
VAFKDLRHFIDYLERQGELRRISAPVSNDLEIAEITDRVSKTNGPALLFENVTGYNVPVLMNAMGSERRMSAALGVEHLTDLSDRVRNLLQIAQGPMPTSIIDKLKTLGNLAQIASFAPKVVKNAPCQEVVLTDEA